MKTHPILLNGPMVRAVLEGRKTQTRRPMKLHPFFCPEVESWVVNRKNASAPTDFLFDLEDCPFGQPGDTLWVRETWNLADPDGDCALPDDVYGPLAPFSGVAGARPIHWRAIYRATSPNRHPLYGAALWRPSIHMPRWASRIDLLVKRVWVERVQDISEADAIAEGVVCPKLGTNGMKPETLFKDLWNSIYGKKPDCSWEDNPWVWAVEFEIKEASDE